MQQIWCLGGKGEKLLMYGFFNDRMLQVMIAQILPLIPPATLHFCVLSSFSVLLSSSELLGLAVLEAPAEVTAPVCGSPRQQSRPGEGVEEDVVMSDTNWAGVWGGCQSSWEGGSGKRWLRVSSETLLCLQQPLWLSLHITVPESCCVSSRISSFLFREGRWSLAPALLQSPVL